MGERNLRKIAFYGPAASGKSWCADYVNSEYRYKRIAFATKVKEIGRDLFKVHTKNGSDRLVLQAIGQGMRQIRDSVWIDYLLQDARDYEMSYHPNGLVLDDLRYKNEAVALRDTGFTLVLVTVPDDLRQWRLATLYPDTPASAYYHASETEWQDIEPDYTVESIDSSVFSQIGQILEQRT